MNCTKPFTVYSQTIQNNVRIRHIADLFRLKRYKSKKKEMGIFALAYVVVLLTFLYEKNCFCVRACVHKIVTYRWLEMASSNYYLWPIAFRCVSFTYISLQNTTTVLKNRKRYRKRKINAVM